MGLAPPSQGHEFRMFRLIPSSEAPSSPLDVPDIRDYERVEGHVLGKPEGLDPGPFNGHAIYCFKHGLCSLDTLHCLSLTVWAWASQQKETIGVHYSMTIGKLQDLRLTAETPYQHRWTNCAEMGRQTGSPLMQLLAQPMSGYASLFFRDGFYGVHLPGNCTDDASNPASCLATFPRPLK
jgi:hypothetical protein